MRILFNDVFQSSNAPESLKSAALADRHAFSGPLDVELSEPAVIDAVGVGGTDASALRVTFQAPETLRLRGGGASSEGGAERAYRGGGAFGCGGAFGADILRLYGGSAADFPASASAAVIFQGSGLYRVAPVIAARVRIEHNGTYIGRFGAGIGVRLGTSVRKEPSFNSTREPRLTLSGQAIPGLGGYSYRSVQLDVRYKIGPLAMSEMNAAYPSQIAAGFPFFLLFDEEAHRLPFARLYAQDAEFSGMSFESGINRFMFSRKFVFEERF
jgi:hypothetical protein